MGSPSTKTVPNLIQGVSQQSAEQRRDSQCEAQFDCLNSPKDGAVARNGADFIKLLPGVDWTTAYTFELFRGLAEHYLAVITKEGVLRVFDYVTGNECTVTPTGTGFAYLAMPSNLLPRDWFRVQTVDDYTFVGNRYRAPAFATAVAPSRNKEALVFFRAGGYSTTYKLTLIYGGTTYSWTYTTPDNSAPPNAAYITTNLLAATFYKAMAGADAPASPIGVGGAVGGDPGGQGSGTPSVLSTPPGAPTLASLGFGISINSNLLHIYRADSNDFAIDSSDGVGDTHVAVLKDNVRAFSDLPKGGFAGFTLRVRGVAEQTRTDYWVEYVNNNPSDGYWQERPAPGAYTTLNPQTMPHGLINTGVNTFTFGPLEWSGRISGDGVETSKNPGFIGRTIEDIYFHKGRLGFLTEASMDWSKAGNVFTHFPDTAQAVLDDAPVNITLAAGNRTALLKKALSVDEGLFAWAQGVQFRINSGSDPFKQSTVDAPEAGAYEFAENCNFAKVGTSVYLATEPDQFVTIRSLQFANGKLAGDIDVTAHVSEYIPAGVRLLSVSDTGQLLFAQTDSGPQNLYLYNFLVQDRQVVQSAWNTWRFPVAKVLRATVYRDKLFMTVQRADGVMFLTMPLSRRAVDPGGAYRTRLDLRVSEAACSLAYNATTDVTTITLPYSLAPGDLPYFRAVIRSNGAVWRRGRLLEVLSGIANTVTVRGDVRGYQFYAGFRIDSRRRPSRFYLRGPDGPVATDELNIREYRVNHAETGYYRIEVNQGAQRMKVAELHPRIVGTADTPVGSPPPLDTGSLFVGVDMQNTECTIELINDSPLPSRWQTEAYTYEATLRSKPSRVRAGGE